MKESENREEGDRGRVDIEISRLGMGGQECGYRCSFSACLIKFAYCGQNGLLKSVSSETIWTGLGSTPLTARSGTTQFSYFLRPR